jgi:hypothetical protein
MRMAVIRIHASPIGNRAIIVIPRENSLITVNVKNQMIYCIRMIRVNVAHDFRNGLGAVQRYTKLLRTGASVWETLAKRVKEGVQCISGCH